MTDCPANAADRKQTLQIYPVGVNEAMTLNYEIICDCPCERPGNPVGSETIHRILKNKKTIDPFWSLSTTGPHTGRIRMQ